VGEKSRCTEYFGKALLVFHSGDMATMIMPAKSVLPQFESTIYIAQPNTTGRAEA